MTPPLHLHGIVPPVATPYDPQGQIDPDSLRRVLRHLLDGGVHGLFVLGSTSECVFLTAAQRAEVVRIAVEVAQGRVPVVAGVMDATTDHCIAHGRQARALGAQALVLTAPYYTRTNQAETQDHFRYVRDAVDLPVILRRIEEESARMKTLVEDLLMLARLDETREVQSVPVDLSVLAADACTDAVAAAPDRKITLDAPDPVVVEGDADQLRQAIANLVTNALKHTPDGTAIEVATRVEDGRGVVSVRDHGPGISGEDRQRVFDRFWRADESRTGTGAGLGLSIVAAITAAHGGEASVDNVPADQGGGARFTLRLPL